MLTDMTWGDILGGPDPGAPDIQRGLDYRDAGLRNAGMIALAFVVPAQRGRSLEFGNRLNSPHSEMGT